MDSEKMNNMKGKISNCWKSVNVRDLPAIASYIFIFVFFVYLSFHMKGEFRKYKLKMDANPFVITNYQNLEVDDDLLDVVSLKKNSIIDFNSFEHFYMNDFAISKDLYKEGLSYEYEMLDLKLKDQAKTIEAMNILELNEEYQDKLKSKHENDLEKARIIYEKNVKINFAALLFAVVVLSVMTIFILMLKFASY